MTISTSSFAKPVPRVWWSLALIALVITAALLAWVARSNYQGHPPGQKTRPVQQRQNALRIILQSNFDLATREGALSENRMSVMPRDNSAGLICHPALLDRNTSTLRMVLPPLPNDRRGVLAVLAPEGRLRIIYVSYGFDLDPEDLITPYSAIDWREVRTRNDFAVKVNKFEVLNPDADDSEPLFQNAGIYQFALLNSIDRDRLDSIGAPFWVIAGCVVRYQP